MNSRHQAAQRCEFDVVGSAARVSALLLRPAKPRFAYVLAHGAGAGMEHPFLDSVAGRLAASDVATFRYQFPYMQQGRRRPDPPHLLMATARSAVQQARTLLEGVPLFAGGKSLGGRMTSGAAAAEPLPGVRGLIFLGFPLHPPGRPGIERAAHLSEVDLPMLFLQGARDGFAKLDLLEPIVASLEASLHVVDGGDHSFEVLKRSGRAREEVMDELVGAILSWAQAVAG